MISIIVPVYKTEEYLEACVSSLLAQTYHDIEIILVDDGSPDNCPALCDSLAENDPRIRVIHKENGGVSTARNAGLEAAAGEYIAFVDSDDYIDANMYENMMTVAENHHCDVVLCDCVKEFPGNPQLYTHDIRGGFYDRDQLENEYFPHLLIMENMEYPATISNWLMLFRRNIAKGIRYLEGVRYSEDLLFGAQILYRANSFFYMKGEAYYHYRMNMQSATHKFVPDKWNDYRKLHGQIRAEFLNCPEYDFGQQIDGCLLFFLYNAVGDILGVRTVAREKKKEMIRNILSSEEVRDMFTRVEIGKLNVSLKQKVITWLYQNRLAIGLLCMYYERR